MYDDVLIKNKRGHTIEQFRQAIHKLRQYAFKFSVHIMPGLYGSTYIKDL
jgi:histone acetyltransferase (RNA polymerase elongator complex component)